MSSTDFAELFKLDLEDLRRKALRCLVKSSDDMDGAAVCDEDRTFLVNEPEPRDSTFLLRKTRWSSRSSDANFWLMFIFESNSATDVVEMFQK
jgi:hypothetical protein